MLIQEEILISTLDQPNKKLSDLSANHANSQGYYKGGRGYNSYRGKQPYYGQGRGINQQYQHQNQNQQYPKVVTIPKPIPKTDKPPILVVPPSLDTSHGFQICDKMGHLARYYLERGNSSAYLAETPNEGEEIQANTITVGNVNWCLDSEATNHMTSDDSRFIKYENYTGMNGVFVGNGEQVKIEKIGKIILNTKQYILKYYIFLKSEKT